MSAVVPSPAAMPEAEYFAHPALSQSGAKLLLAEGGPALFRYRQQNPQPPKQAFDVGHACHKLVLGVGADLVIVKAKDWKTNAAKEQRDEAYAAGKVPLLTTDHDAVRAMAEAVMAHPTAAALFEAGIGAAEQSIFWTDESGVDLRSRLDWLPDVGPHRMIVPDLKTCVSATKDALSKAFHDRAYHVQAAFYRAAVIAHELDPDPAFVFAFVEKTPPHLVRVVEPDAWALHVGERLMRKAIDLYRTCTDTDTWPAYGDDVQLIGLPRWAPDPDEESAA